jgi:hypothetical protein
MTTSTKTVPVSKWFASQLNTEIQSEYDHRQLAIWEYIIR